MVKREETYSQGGVRAQAHLDFAWKYKYAIKLILFVSRIAGLANKQRSSPCLAVGEAMGCIAAVMGTCGCAADPFPGVFSIEVGRSVLDSSWQLSGQTGVPAVFFAHCAKPA